MSKTKYQIAKDFDNSEKKIHIKCLQSIHALIFNDDNIDVSFLEKIIIKNKKIISCSFYWVWGDYKAKWSASFGYDKEEHYTVYEDVAFEAETSKGTRVTRYRKEPVTKTKIVTDWNPAQGTDDGDFKESFYAGKFFANNTPAFFNQLTLPVEGNKFNEKKYDIIDEYNFTENQIIKQADSLISNHIHNEVAANNRQGDQQKDWRISYNLSNINTATVNCPIVVSDLEFNKKKYKLIYSADDSNTNCELPEQELPVDKEQLDNSKKLLFSRWKGLILLGIFFFSFYIIKPDSGKKAETLIEYVWAYGFGLSFIYAFYVFFYFRGLITDKLKQYQSTIDKILSERINKL